MQINFDRPGILVGVIQAVYIVGSVGAIDVVASFGPEQNFGVLTVDGEVAFV